MLMDEFKPTPRTGAASEEAAQPISIAIIYKDKKSRDQAAKLCKRLARNLKPEFQFCLKWWQFDALRDTKAARAASVAIAAADLVIVSTRAGLKLPLKVKSWMRACLMKRKMPDGALVALMRMAKGLQKGATPVHSFLCAIARQTKMDYLPEFIYPVPGRI